jgi:hypothetical protein
MVDDYINLYEGTGGGQRGRPGGNPTFWTVRSGAGPGARAGSAAVAAAAVDGRSVHARWFGDGDRDDMIPFSIKSICSV